MNIYLFIDTVLKRIGLNLSGWPYGYILQPLLVYLIEAILVFLFVAIMIIIVIYVFRKYMADLQERIGPNRVGPLGTFQLIADALKMFAKEDIVPEKADRSSFLLAPYVVFIPLVLVFVLIPYGTFYLTGNIIFSNVIVTFILILAFSAVSPIGEIIAGAASNSKFALIGAWRTAAQDISYEVPLLIAALGVIMMASSTNVNDIVSAQHIPFIILQPLGFIVFFAGMLGKASVIPFDLPESESELVAGFQTEYSGLRFGLFYLGVFGNIFFVSLLISTLYLGGYGGFWFLPGLIWLMIKTFILVFIFLTFWIAMPRVRVDLFMKFGWKYLLPIALVNLIWVTIYVMWW